MRAPASLAFIAVLLAGCTAMAGDLSPTPAAPTMAASPTDSAAPSATATPVPNLREGVASEGGLFIGSWSSEVEMPQVNEVHTWTLHIEDATGLPVEGATVVVDGDMPAHGHGMPTQPEVTADLGTGDYRVDGMAFQMGGYWVVDVTVSADGETDTIHFGLDLPE
ncbi:MAG TPA: FixH family protein [Candidatus Limnocylindria bacterium]|nr:FixH family protein [Candidatus Limnocylindria bacterium]